MVAGFEGPSEGCYFVDEAPGRPNVRFFVVFAVAHLLGGHVVRSAHVGLRELRVLPHFSTQSEVSQFDVVVLVDENVGRFNVAV